MPKLSALLVVDTNILRGASRTDGGPPEGAACRACLEDIYQICHRIVVNSALLAEYEQHASGFGTRWLTAMRRKSKVVTSNSEAETSRERRWLQHPVLRTEARRQELKKDLHLVRASLDKVAPILSAEKRARELLSEVIDVERDGTINWHVLGPTTHDWLTTGAGGDQPIIASLPKRTKGRRA